MCSIFGYIASPGHKVPLSHLRQMAQANVGRGPHAFGFAWITADGRLRAYKQCGRITDHLGLLAMTRGARVFIGHTRWATHGSPRDNINNHPHPVDGGWLVHNGVVRNYCDLLKERNLTPVSECDSEALGLMMEASEGNFIQRTRRAISATAGNLAMLALWKNPSRLIVARAGNPLSTCATSSARYFSTLAEGLEDISRRVVEIDDNTVTEYNLSDNSSTKGTPHARIQKITHRRRIDHVQAHCRSEAMGSRGGSAQGYAGG